MLGEADGPTAVIHSPYAWKSESFCDRILMHSVSEIVKTITQSVSPRGAAGR